MELPPLFTMAGLEPANQPARVHARKKSLAHWFCSGGNKRNQNRVMARLKKIGKSTPDFCWLLPFTKSKKSEFKRATALRN
jgi:hypothetical protein